MKLLFNNIRFYVLAISLIVSGIVWLWVQTIIIGNQLQIIRLEQIYGMISIIYLYLTLLAGPFCFTFRSLPFSGQYLKSRRALGVSVFYFALLHSFLSFFGQLGGFKGIGFLSNSFLIAGNFGFIALVIFFFLAITSFDFAVSKVSFAKWKVLHRFVYLAGVVTLIHVCMLGTHFSDLSGIPSQITFIALAFLLLLEAPRIDRWLRRWLPLPHFGLPTIVLSTFLGSVYFTFFSPFITTSSGIPSFDIHAAHRQLAQQALQQSQFGNNQFSPNIDISKIPGLNGDRTKRYTMTFNNPQDAQPNQDVTLRFRTYDASSGNPISLYRIIYAKPIHMIITDSSLTYFSHIHPTQDGYDFVITTQFPKSDIYHIYLEFQPYGGIEQQVAFTLPVGDNSSLQTPSISKGAAIPVDTNLTKTFGNYTVTLNTHGTLTAKDMTLGNDLLSFTIKDAKTKQPVTNLKPYLAAFGHLTMINETSYDFLHVHPYSLIVPQPDATSGPTVDFLPIGIYEPFKPGIYRVFAEFNPDGHLFTADFTVRVQ